MTQRVAFRVDASASIGGGHLVRCLALARVLLSRGCRVSFVSRDLPEVFRAEVVSAGVELNALPTARPEARSAEGYEAWLGAPWEHDAAQTAAALDAAGPLDWLVVDHYGTDARWEARLRPSCAHILAVEDLTHRRHDCDLLLNQNLSARGGEGYKDLVPPDCRLLLGPDYALLRPQFARARADLHRDAERVSRVLVFFGAYDAHGVTMRTLNAIAQSGWQLSVTAVLGALNPQREDIRGRFGHRLAVHVVERVSDMAALVADADIGFGAGGTAMWERCCLGLPAVVLALADNQLEPASAAAKRGACLYLGEVTLVSEANLLEGLGRLLNDTALRRSMAEAGMELVDGLGCERVADAILGAAVRVRPARAEDAPIVFPWRNSEQVRRFSHDSAPLTLEGHLAWFRRALADDDRVLLIAEDARGPLGVLRYDLQGEVATVSIYLDPERRGHGHGGALLREGEVWLRAQRPRVRRLRAEVLVDNLASLKVFEASGFARRESVFEKALR